MKSTSINLESTDFDARARQLHAAALANLSPQTLQSLRASRNQALRARSAHTRWWLSATVPALLAVAIGLPWLVAGHGGKPAPAHALRSAHVATTTNKPANSSDDYSTQLDENPDLYLWMASNGKQLAME